jgi:glycerate kinase
MTPAQQSLTTIDRSLTVLVSPDKFRGSLTARAAADALAAGLSTTVRVRTRTLPVADGGEGTIGCLLGAGFHARATAVTDHDGRPVRARIATRGDLAVIECAQACGLGAFPREPAAAETATSHGVGELLRAALDMGYRRLLVGVGGTASTDGGAGLLQALGAGVRDDHGTVLPRGGAGLAALRHLDLRPLDPRLAESRLLVATDVDNPLVGPDGAATTFGPQKGADAASVERLAAGLERLARHLDRAVGRRLSREPGTGAGGGIAYALMALGAHRVSGAEALLDLLEFNRHARNAALVVSGEGAFDATSLAGKAPVTVARRARRLGVPVAIVAGRAEVTDMRLRQLGIDRVYQLVDLAHSSAHSMRAAARLLTEVGSDIAAWLEKSHPRSPATDPVENEQP